MEYEINHSDDLPRARVGVRAGIGVRGFLVHDQAAAQRAVAWAREQLAARTAS